MNSDTKTGTISLVGTGWCKAEVPSEEQVGTQWSWCKRKHDEKYNMNDSDAKAPVLQLAAEPADCCTTVIFNGFARAWFIWASECELRTATFSKPAAWDDVSPFWFSLSVWNYFLFFIYFAKDRRLIGTCVLPVKYIKADSPKTSTHLFIWAGSPGCLWSLRLSWCSTHTSTLKKCFQACSLGQKKVSIFGQASALPLQQPVCSEDPGNKRWSHSFRTRPWIRVPMRRV